MEKSASTSSAPRTTELRRYIWYKRAVVAITLLVLIIVALLSLNAGSAGLSPRDIVDGILNRDGSQNATVMWNLRIPRAIVAIVVGAALAMSGVIMQNVLRNPLASASTLGVSQGAAFGAAVAIVYFEAGTQVNSASGSAISISNPVLVSTFAFLGGIGTTALILVVSRMRGVSPTTMVLAGVALSAMFSAGTSLVQYFADDVQVASVVYWTFGSLGRASWGQIGIIAVITLAAFLFFMYHRWNYNALESGTNTAKSLGVNVNWLIPISLAVCALIASISVAFVGVIGFIGLVAPHIMRLFVGNDFSYLVPATLLCGSILLLLADIFSRTIISPTVLPIGAVTSLVGAPIFLFLLLRRSFDR